MRTNYRGQHEQNRDFGLVKEIELKLHPSISGEAKGIGISSSENGLIDKFKNILSPRVVEDTRERRKLRNILTHAYSNIRFDENVYNSTLDLKKVKQFMREVEMIISKT